MKKLILSLALICVMLLSVEAQSRWDGFFRPVTLDKVVSLDGDKAGTSAWLFRPAVTVAATVFNLGFKEDGTFDGVQASYLSKTGLALSFAHYIDNEGEAFNNYSINGMLLLPTDGTTNAALAVTASAYRVNAGFGYNIIKESSFKENIFFLTGVQFTF
jgi:hypothetical protein